MRHHNLLFSQWSIDLISWLYIKIAACMGCLLMRKLHEHFTQGVGQLSDSDMSITGKDWREQNTLI